MTLALSLYSRPGCHLCEQMLEELEQYQSAVTVNVINIDDDPELIRKFAARIPVLAMGDTEICQYHLDQDALSNYLKKVESN